MSNVFATALGGAKRNPTMESKSTGRDALIELFYMMREMDAVDRLEIAALIASKVLTRMPKRKRILLICTALFLVIGLLLLFAATITAPGETGELARISWAFLAGAMFTLAALLLSRK